MRSFLLITVIAAALGCETPPRAASRAAGDADAGKPMAYVDGDPVRDEDLMPKLLESAGGQALAELILDWRLKAELDRLGLSVTETDLTAEKRLMLETLDEGNEDTATQLLRKLREERGFGEERFNAVVWRNAAMRRLVQPEVSVSPAAVDRQYELVYGPRYEARIIVVPTVREADAALRRLNAGAVFETVAAESSTDPTAAAGGLLGAVSTADPTYPKSLRDALRRLPPGGLSEAIALESDFAILKLERKIDGQPIELQDVRPRLERDVRRTVEAVLMRQKARSLLSEARVVVLDPALGRGWRRQKAAWGNRD